jgi:hypothetical protein
MRLAAPPTPVAGKVASRTTSAHRGNHCITVASEGRLRVAGAQPAERTRQYVSMASIAGKQAAD